MRIFSFSFFAFLSLAFLCAPAAQAQSSMTHGQYNGQSGAPVMEMDTPTPPKTPTAPAAPIVPLAGHAAPVIAAPAAAATTTDTKKIDPCAAFMRSYDSYTLCQDHMQKIEHMKAVAKKREADFDNPPPENAAAKPKTKTDTTADAPHVEPRTLPAILPQTHIQTPAQP